MANKKRRKKKKKGVNIALFVIEIVVLIVLVVGIFAFAKINRSLNENLGTDLAGQVTNDNTDDVVINTEVAKNERLTGYTNIALVGIDTREQDIDYANSDTMLVASINNDTWGVRMISLYRDTYLNINPDSEEGNFNKANAAYAFGSVNQFLSMLNANLDLNITQYVIVDFNAVATLIDDLGGINITLTEQEVVHLNNYCVETAEVTGMPYTPLEYDEGMEAREYTLNGVQGVSYARIRYTEGNDPKRTQRQRLVIQKIVEKAKGKGLASVTAIIEDVFPKVKTNFTSSQLIKMASQMFNYNIEYTSGFPFEHLETDIGELDAVVPVTLAENVSELHAFLFDDTNYQVSQAVKAYSDRIVADSGFGESYRNSAIENGKVPDTGSEADLAR